MKIDLSDVSEKAGNAFWVLAILIAILFFQQFLDPSPPAMIISGLFVLAIWVIWLLGDAHLDWRFKKNYPWLFTVSGTKGSQSLSEIEKTALEGSTVYLITPDMHNDAHNIETQKCVISNLERNVSYVFITLNNTPEAESNIMEVQRYFAVHKDVLQIYIANELFNSLPTYNMLIIEKDSKRQKRVFVELPVLENMGTSSKRAYWAEAESDFAIKLHAKVLHTLKGMVPIENEYHAS